MSDQHFKSLDQVMAHGNDRKVLNFRIEDDSLDGRMITVEGEQKINFGSCSYLGLEKNQKLVDATIDAVQRYGTQFSSSKTYAALGLYSELESKLGEMYGKPVLVSATTTLGHLSIIPALIKDNDAVVMDMQVHASVQMTAQLLKARGIKMTIIRHNDMEKLEEKILSLKEKHDKVWYFADGVYSMYGDYAPLDKLQELLDKHPKFHMYLDDAHGMSWAGENGVGYVRSQMEHHPKMVMSISLNKAFGAAGGAIIFPDEETATWCRNCGGTFIFSGPIQPPMLGTAIASVNMHLSGELKPIQDKVKDLISYMNEKLNSVNLPQFEETDSPLFFIPTGPISATMNLNRKMVEDGLFVNAAGFPATPMKRSGLRFMIHGNLQKSDIDVLVAALQKNYVLVLEEEGLTFNKIAKSFGIPEFEVVPVADAPQPATAKATPIALFPEMKRSIHGIDQQEWDLLQGKKGNFNSSSLAMIEEVFSQQESPEENWDFYYYTVRDSVGKVVLSTFYTSAILKDDMFSPASISAQIETERKLNPLYLTSKSVVLGSMITKGEQLFLDRDHPQWKAALGMLIDQMQETVAEQNATQLLIKEFMGEKDAELEQVFLNMGLTSLTLPSACVINNMSWTDKTEYLHRLGPKYRYDVRREILKHEHKFEVVTEKPNTEKEIQECYTLYNNVYDRSLEMNVHRLPYSFFEAMAANPEYDIIRLYLKEEDAPGTERTPIGVMFSFQGSEIYNALIVGLDYEFVRSHGTYKQILYRTVWRAWELGCSSIDLAFTAELVKKKVGARPVQTMAYVQLQDHFNQAIIASMSKATPSLSKAS